MGDAEHAYAIPMDPDDAFWVISNSRRRQVVLSLAQFESALTASELTVEIVAIESLIDPSKVASEQRTRVYASLVRSRLETLDRAGVVECDERGKWVSSADATEPVTGHIRRTATACYGPDAGRGDES